VVAQVDEEELPVIALAIHPSGQANGLPHVVFAKRAAGVRAV
jgi:hypothetical protein